MPPIVFKDNNKRRHFPNDLSSVKFRPAVYVIVENKDKEILLIVDEKSGKWEIPGGGLEIGEDLSSCAVREVKEETGYAICLTSDMPYLIEKDMAYTEKGNYLHALNFFYI